MSQDKLSKSRSQLAALVAAMLVGFFGIGQTSAQHMYPPCIWVTVNMPEDALWSLEPIQETTCTRPSESATGAGRIRILDESGVELFVTRFDRQRVCPLADQECYYLKWRTLYLPYFTTARRLEIYQNENLNDALDRSAHSPSVEIQSPKPGDALEDGKTVISWTTKDADGDSVKVIAVRYSHDRGRSWTPIGDSPYGSSMVFERNGLPASSDASLEVWVTDGFNNTFQDVRNLRLEGNQPPWAGIGSPRDWHCVAAGANIVLQGYASDPEDGWPKGTNRWLSDRDGLIAEQSLVNWIGGSMGLHHLTFEATDSGGLTASDSVRVVIRSPAFPPRGCRPDIKLLLPWLHQ